MERPWMKSWPKDVPRELVFPQKPLPEFLRDHARRTPHKVAVNFYGREITFGELNTCTDRLAAALSSFGLRKGDRVSLFLENSPQFIISYFAVLRAGGVVVAANPMFKEEELAYEIRDAGAKVLIAQDVLYARARGIRAEAGLTRILLTSYADYLPPQPTLPLHPSMGAAKERFPETLDLVEVMDASKAEPPLMNINLQEDLALLQYTSGTTGLPKGAMLSHAAVLFNTAGSATWLGIGEEDVILSVLPYFHVTGMVHGMNMPIYAGRTNVLLSRFDPETVVRAIDRYRCTIWTSITTMNVAMINFPDVDKYDLKSLRRCGSGGAPVPLEVLEKWRAKVRTELSEGYGLSETMAQTHMNPVSAPRYGTVGIPSFGVDCRMVDVETGKDIALHQEGELYVQTPSVMKGYWNRPEETKDVLRDGWLATGDIARMDELGYFSIVGRKKDLIKASGYSVFPAEVENFLYAHPAVKEVAVVGVPDPYRGENIKAFIVLKPGYEDRVREEEIVAWCREKMAAYKYPRLVEFVEELPKTASGKVLKRVLRARIHPGDVVD